MRAIFLLTTGFCLVLSSAAHAQMGGGMGGMGGMSGGGQGGGRGGGGRHHGNKGQGGGNPTGGAPGDARPAAAVLSAAMRLKGVVTIASETKTLSGVTIPSDKPDMSGLYAIREANVTLDKVNITSTSMASLVADSHAFGINSALLIDTAAKVHMTGGKIATQGQGANAAYVSGDDAGLSLADASLSTGGTGAYGVDVRGGAGLEVTNTTIITGSDHAPAIAAEAGARPVHLSGGVFTTQGPSSPVFSLSADLDATGVTASAGRAEGAVITGHHRVSFTDSSISAQGYGVMIYEAPDAHGGGMPDGGGFDPARRHGPRSEGPSPEGEAAKGNSVRPVADMMAPLPENGPGVRGLQITGGKLSGQRAAFYVTNMRAHIALDGVEIGSASGIILKSTADQWGDLGRNGGDAVLDAHHQILTGDFVTDVISHVAVNLSEGSHLTGKATRNTDITLDTTSTWTLTDDSAVGKLTADPAQINSQGHTLSYDTFRNPSLNDKTIPLPGGGKLVPSSL